ncbi:unnamed protein product [Paramecium pentaurelia]|uniref:Uncharacterized protein n=1 Tax=Paramecium pentaurelia TaxID=43138 RepID=A0A8S1Y7W5_9CILI|nr:unnamed protein product [Paramecium pentaurelia]
MLDELEFLVEKELAKLNSLNGINKTSQIVQQPLKQNKDTVNLIIQIDKPKEVKQLLTEQCSFRPMLSRKSLRIAEKLGDAKERLTKPRSVTPEIKEQSQSQTRKRTISGIAPRWEQLYTLDQFYKSKKETLRLQLELERSKENETTFQPNLSKSQTKYCDFTMPFEQRNRYWETKKQEKLVQYQKDVQNESQQLCTFKPQVNKKIAQKSVKVSEFNKKGLITYFERVQQANKKKEEPKKSSKWKPGITIPQEFKLSHTNRQI